MANHVVSGQLVPDAVSGHVALEIANTRASWGSENPREYLVSYDALAVWAGDVGLMTAYEVRTLRSRARRAPAEADDVVRAAIDLRESWYAVATAAQRGVDVPTLHLEVVGEHAARAAAASRLVAHEDGRVLPDGGSVPRSGLRLPVDRAAQAAAEMLAVGDHRHAGACPGRGCGWLFFDPAHRRHWCIMAICGNRAKARAFAERRRAAAGLP
ncbi:MAG: ABATE domain-containing protein [Candidatus Nanopelagicales bacterium]